MRALSCQILALLLLSAQCALLFHAESHDQPALDAACAVCVHAPAAIGPAGSGMATSGGLIAARHEPPAVAVAAPHRTATRTARARAPPVHGS